MPVSPRTQLVKLAVGLASVVSVAAVSGYLAGHTQTPGQVGGDQTELDLGPQVNADATTSVSGGGEAPVRGRSDEAFRREAGRYDDHDEWDDDDDDKDEDGGLPFFRNWRREWSGGAEFRWGQGDAALAPPADQGATRVPAPAVAIQPPAVAIQPRAIVPSRTRTRRS